MVTEQLCCICL